MLPANGEAFDKLPMHSIARLIHRGILLPGMHFARLSRCLGAYAILFAIVACQKEPPRSSSSAADVQATTSTPSTVSTTVISEPPRASHDMSSSEPEGTRSADETRNGWGRVAWGMTESEVTATYPSVVRVNPPDDYDRADALATLALPGVQAADLEFTAKFLFGKRTNKLAMVLLSRQPERPSEYTQAFNALLGKYGSPVQSKELNVTSLDRSSPEQERKTRIGSASSSWVTPSAIVSLEYLEAVGTGHLLLSYKPRPDDRNL
jgi:hypothetical protein